MNLEELEKRVQAVEDLEAIKKLHQKYMNLMDNLQYESVPALFTDDASVEIRDSGVKKGREEIDKMYLGIGAMKKAKNNCHMAIQPDITVSGDTASGSWMVYMFYFSPSVDWVQGRNDVEYRKVKGIWKISKLKFTRTLASKKEMYP
jgi:ketosteroid isomerase-like protein